MPSPSQPAKPLPPGTIEYEFGVPVPGVILPPEQWTHSELRSWPTDGPVDWKVVFGRQAPVVLDLGCGNGRSVLLSAIRRPDHDHLGADILPVVIRYARKRARQRGLANVRFAVADARSVVAYHLAPGSVAEVHLYHPQPYYDMAHASRRLITPLFLLQVHRVLAPHGLLVIQTDNPAYWRYIGQVAPAFFDFQEHSDPWPDAPEGRSRREILARSRGLPVFRGTGRARVDFDPADARRVAETLPPPAFNADRRLQELDRMEGGPVASRPPGRGTRHPRRGRGPNTPPPPPSPRRP